MKLTSLAFSDNQKMPADYTCDGKNINPPLYLVEIPDNAASLVLIVDDPDAPGGSWIHWLVWNISPGISEIPEDSIPVNGVEGMNSSGAIGYDGPCPPSGVHRYIFKVYALDTKLDFGDEADKNLIEQAMAGHILDQTDLVGLYSRG